jgi:hypothetical protein
MPWKVDGKSVVGFDLAAYENSRAIGKHVDSRDILEGLELDHIDD